MKRQGSLAERIGGRNELAACRGEGPPSSPPTIQHESSTGPETSQHARSRADREGLYRLRARVGASAIGTMTASTRLSAATSSLKRRIATTSSSFLSGRTTSPLQST